MAGQRTTRALERVDGALARLEAAFQRQTLARGQIEAIADDRDRLAHDRARMAQALDDAAARSERLAEANADVEARLITIMAALRQAKPGEESEP
ncbi:MAG: DUF4164 family protein [Pseudomonadota bacterium]